MTTRAAEGGKETAEEEAKEEEGGMNEEGENEERGGKEAKGTVMTSASDGFDAALWEIPLQVSALRLLSLCFC